MADLPVALSIAGSDSGAGAGIQADLLTFAGCGVFGTTALTCVTAQNPGSVTAVHALEPTLVLEQCRQVARYFHPAACKTGMLFDASIIRAVVAFLKENPSLPCVIDPVMVATSGAVLLREDARTAMSDELFPLARLLTPNLDEAALLVGAPLKNETEARAAALLLASRHGTAVLLKGGHLPGARLTDVLAFADGTVRTFSSERIEGVDTHGSGCTLSAAITAHLALGRSLVEAVELGRGFLRNGLEHPVRTAGRAFIAHGPSPR
jgi:hydroxymethylpyrimidine/phosphomethylpyrimidine kinase